MSSVMVPAWLYIYKQVCAHNIFQLREACPGSSWEMKEQSQGAEAKVEKRPFSERLKRSLMKWLWRGLLEQVPF